MVNADGKTCLCPARADFASSIIEFPSRIEALSIPKIRVHDETQCRVSIDSAIIDEYAKLMSSGAVFPPVRVWFDGDSHWLSDGFQRIAASKLLGHTTINSEVRDGTLDDAKWDSYAANAHHGVRRTKLDIELAIRRTLAHPNAATMSNISLARHLGIPEPTLRRWRRKISPEDECLRRVTRGSGEYLMHVTTVRLLIEQNQLVGGAE